MKIFYAVQATGNGHIARAVELIPHLMQHGTVDVFLSGNNSSLNCSLSAFYKSKGVSLHYSQSGGLDYFKMIREFSVRRIWKEAKDLPVEKYDCVLIDFESIAALSCRLKKVKCIGFGHQASFQSSYSPRPKTKEIAGEWVLKNYAPATIYTGLHFKAYDNFIFNPILKKEILHAEPQRKNYVTVYLPQYDDAIITKQLLGIREVEFHVFSKKAKQVSSQKNIIIKPVDNNCFNESIINCYGVITGAGFETPAEVLYLGKKLLCIPVKGQYEQKCNTAALSYFNVPIAESINNLSASYVLQWLNNQTSKPLELKYTTAQIVQHVMQQAKMLRQ